MIQIKDNCEFWYCRRGRQGICEKECLKNLCNGFAKCFNCAKIYHCSLIFQNYSYRQEVYDRCFKDFDNERTSKDFEYYNQQETKRNEEKNKELEAKLNFSTDYRRKNIKKVPKFENLEAFYKWLSRNESL